MRLHDRRVRAALATLAFLLAWPSVLVATAGESPVATATALRKSWEHESSDLPVDPRIRFGSLRNGVRYAIANNPEPRQRCYLRLHVDVGSLAEEEDERGMAHFLEHMAFNGSENFAPDELIKWFQSHGMAFGADTNAMTSFSETIYEIDLPVSDRDSVASGLQVLRDFAGGLLLEQDQIDAEKGVIDGEERERDSARMRMLEQYLRKLMPDARLPRRMPIGVKEARDAFDRDGLFAFYRRWYRPDRMTLAVVGDLGELDPVELIESAFGDLENPVGPRAEEPDPGPGTYEDRCFVVREPEAAVVQITIHNLKPYRDRPVNRATVAEDVPLSLARSMLNRRMRKLTARADAPFLAGFSMEGGEGLRVYSGGALMVASSPDGWETALAAAENELRRALSFGFAEAELAAVLADFTRSLDEAAEREGTQDSREILQSILQAAETRDVPMRPSDRRDLLLEIASAVSADDCQKALAEEWSDGALVVSVAGPVDLGDSDQAASRVREVLERARSMELEDPTGARTAKFAYASEREPAKAEERRVEDLDVFQYVFENGVRLNVKRTDFKDREVLVRLELGEGGLSLDPYDPALAMVASTVFVSGGLGAHRAEDLDEVLAGRQANVSFSIEDDRFALSGRTSPDDLKLQLELLCAYLTDPAYREDPLARLREEAPLMFEAMEHSVTGPMQREFLPALFGSPRLAGFPTLDELLAVEMADVRRWLDPSLREAAIELTIVGDVPVERALDAVARTVGHLPERRALRIGEALLDQPAPRAGLRMEREVETQVEKALVHVSFPATDGIDPTRRRTLHLLGLVLDEKLREHVRERLGVAYSPTAGADTSTVFPGVGRVYADVMADPGRAEDVLAAILDVARDLREHGVTEDELERVKEPQLARVRDMLRSNRAWLAWVSGAQRDPAALDRARTALDFYREIEPAALGRMARAYLDPERSSVLIVKPAARSEEEGDGSGR